MKCQNSKLPRRPLRHQQIQPQIRRRRSQSANRHIRRTATPTQLLQLSNPRRTTTNHNAQRPEDLDIPPERRRPILCDGESLAFNEVSRSYDAARIEAGVRWFQSAGHRAVAIIPRDLRGKATNVYALDNLHNEGRLTVVECSGGSAEVNEPLEKDMLEKAQAEQAVVISEREFRGVYGNYSNVRQVVENRVVGFCFFKGEIFIPRDPYGRNRPFLEDILSL